MRFPPIDRFLLLIVTLGLCATLVELVLEEHTESFFQWIPIGLIAAALGALAWNQITQGAASGRVLRVLWVLFLVSGVVGVGLHWKGKIEFQLESSPSLSGWDLFRQAMKSKTPPALAPGVMVQFGLVGLAFQAAQKARRSKEK